MIDSESGSRRSNALRVSVCVLVFIAIIAAFGPASPAADATSAAPAPGSLPWSPPSPAFRIHVESDAVYRLDYAYLSAAGLPVDTIDPASFRLLYMGDEVPLRVEDGGDGRFDAGDAVFFGGRGVDSLFFDGLTSTRVYSAASVFWLTYGGQSGLRMAERVSLPDGAAVETYRRTQRNERQFLYRSSRPMLPNADHWFADSLSSGTNPGERNYTITDATLPAGSFTARVKVSVQGNRDGGHRLRVFVNGTQVLDDSTSWSAFGLFQPEVDFPQSLLQPGDNVIKVQLVSGVGGKTSDSALTDWVELTYSDAYLALGDQLGFTHGSADDCGGETICDYTVPGFSAPEIDVYDVTTLTGTARVTGVEVTGDAPPYSASFGDAAGSARRYVTVAPGGYKVPEKIEPVQPLQSSYTPTDLLNPAGHADYIIVSHPDFWAEALTLAKHRSRRYQVAVVDVQQIYDRFNGGHMSAEAIRDFLAHAYISWPKPAPAFALLLGDGTYDMRNYRGTSAPTYIPPYLEHVDPDLGETATDNRFVAFSGDDTLPAMAIGRLVANSPAEAGAMVKKIVDYEVGCQCGAWNYNTLFLADDLEGGGGNFYAYSDEIADGYADPANTVPLIPPTFNIQKAYLGQTCDVLNNPAVASECRQQTTTTLNGLGALFVSYVGHSTKTEWATEKMMDPSLIASLTNGPCLPINLAMTCLEGFFHEAAIGTASLAEIAVRTPVHGAVASWSPTGLGLVTGHDYLERGLMLALFHQGIAELGPATNYAKKYLWDNAGGQHRDLIDTFVLLGDPALEVKTEAVCLGPTSVTLAGFDATAQRKGIRLEWQTEDERGILAFNLLRRSTTSAAGASETAYRTLNRSPILARKAGLGEGARYVFGDATVRRGMIYEYALEVLSVDGGSQQFGPLQATASYLPFATPPGMEK
jgi:hypothetical protein